MDEDLLSLLADPAPASEWAMDATVVEDGYHVTVQRCALCCLHLGYESDARSFYTRFLDEWAVGRLQKNRTTRRPAPVPPLPSGWLERANASASEERVARYVLLFEECLRRVGFDTPVSSRALRGNVPVYQEVGMGTCWLVAALNLLLHIPETRIFCTQEYTMRHLLVNTLIPVLTRGYVAYSPAPDQVLNGQPYHRTQGYVCTVDYFYMLPASREGANEMEVWWHALCAPTPLVYVRALFLQAICAYPWLDRAAMVARATHFLHEDLPSDMLVAVDLLLPPVEVFLDDLQRRAMEANVGGPYQTLLVLYGEVHRRCTTMPALAAPETWRLFCHLFV